MTEDGELAAHCFGGCYHADVLKVLLGYGLLDADGIELLNEVPVRERTPEERVLRSDGARRLYSRSTDDLRLRRYLRSRAITLLSPVLRFCPDAPHRTGRYLPAMVAPVVDVHGEQIGTHLTYLRPDGSGKADFADPEYQRECRGEVRGGVVRLATHDPERELVIGEGLETSLSAMEIYGRPGWAAVYAANLKDTLELPEAIRNIVIAADNDANGTGQRAALAAYRRWTAEGRLVEIVMPPRTGTDFNDLLMTEA